MHALVIVLELLTCQGNVKTPSYTVEIMEIEKLEGIGCKVIWRTEQCRKEIFRLTVPVTISPRQNFLPTKTKVKYRRKIRLIECNAKCRHLK
jgi:hypothetical protein